MVWDLDTCWVAKGTQQSWVSIFNTYATPPKGRFLQHFDNFKSNLPPEGGVIAKIYGKESNWYQRPLFP